MPQYRVFGKTITNINGRPILSAETRIINCKIKRDITTKVTSTFEVVNIPSAYNVGDVIGIYNAKGKINYLGIITNINTDSNTIDTNQIISIFDIEFLYKYSEYASIGAIEGIITTIVNKLKNNGGMLAAIFNSFNLVSSTTTEGKIVATDDSTYTTFNLMNTFLDFYDMYDVIVDVDIPFTNLNPTIKLKKYDTNNAILIKDNVSALRNFTITRAEASTNVLHIVNSKTGDIAASYYMKNDGTITTTDEATDRPHKLKIKYVETEDVSAAALESLLKENMPTNALNHKITFEMVLDNNIFNFDNLELGSWAKIYIGNDYYLSALTGYELSINEQGVSDVVKLTFGKVRETLESRLFKNV